MVLCDLGVELLTGNPQKRGSSDFVAAGAFQGAGDQVPFRLSERADRDRRRLQRQIRRPGTIGIVTFGDAAAGPAAESSANGQT